MLLSNTEKANGHLLLTCIYTLQGQITRLTSIHDSTSGIGIWFAWCWHSYPARTIIILRSPAYRLHLGVRNEVIAVPLLKVVRVSGFYWLWLLLLPNSVIPHAWARKPKLWAGGCRVIWGSRFGLRVLWSGILLRLGVTSIHQHEGSFDCCVDNLGRVFSWGTCRILGGAVGC